MSERRERGNSTRTRNTQAPKPGGFSVRGIFYGENRPLFWGAILLTLGLLMFIAFLSHVFTGSSDQSAIDGLWTDQTVRQADNALGLWGAVISQVFVYRWFGIGALLIPIIPILAGWTLLSGEQRLPLATISRHVVFYTLWISLLMGYFVMMSESQATWGFLSGGFGYEANLILFTFLKWGSFIVILMALFFFALSAYDITSPGFLKNLPLPDFRRRHSDSPEEDPETEASPRPLFTPGSNSFEPSEPVPARAPFIISSTKNEPPSQPTGPAFEVLHEEIPAIEPELPKGPLELEIEEEQPAEPVVAEEKTLSEELVEEFGEYDSTLDLPTYRNPGVDLLALPDDNPQEKVSHEELEGNKNRIVETLGSYGIRIAKIKATIGPTVTLYEIIPEAGVRISKIQSLEKDIALSLSALGIRIIAPMPGRGTIGIEVPNKRRETVYIRSVFSSDRFQKATYDLPIVLGKTVSNEIYVADLAKMPHLLIAGATGQGKSVGLNVLLASLIYRKHPSQLKFVLVDPKKVELTLFNHLERHYLAKLPNSDEAIITDTKKVIYTLNSLCIEMDSRYDLLKEAAVRNLKEYNAKFVERKLNPQKGHRFLPFIVLVIDELADLMMTAGKEVETPIARLAQLARAVGIHLVVATQRPSVKVITGLIKANFPARLSFKVTSSIDSRTILDAGGAEQLVGHGDMLLSLNSEMLRLQCPFIDTKEVEAICNFVGNQRGYNEAYALPEFEGDDTGELKEDVDINSFDPLLPDAARLVVTHQQGSTSLIQRKMKLGYNRAGRIMDQLETLGITGPFTGSKAREVLFHDLDSLDYHLKTMGLD
ncbi:DNA translocase FtsK [Ravibacter arvi]|uniref:DNA translocase FtsK n=1 Tax=Ravibacter arvi TaxID=2051041 RepID=A0ABP8M9Q7_9BACT